MQCALLYLALEKQSALAAMFRAVKNEKIAAFMARDFTDPANRQSAVKNACTLLSQHKYAQSAAFFLLADRSPLLVKRDLSCSKRDLLLKQKRPITEAKETYILKEWLAARRMRYTLVYKIIGLFCYIIGLF